MSASSDKSKNTRWICVAFTNAIQENGTKLILLFAPAKLEQQPERKKKYIHYCDEENWQKLWQVN